MKHLVNALLCTLVFASFHAHAKDTGTDPSVTIIKDIQHYVVQTDGSYVVDMESKQKINEERGVKARAQQQFSFNRTLESIDILEAYTEKPDGRKVMLLPEHIKLQQEPAYNGAPMFQDMQVKVAIFPEVAVGDQLYIHYRKTRSKALFPDQFSDTTTPSFHPTEQLTLIYDMPATMPLKSMARSFKASAPVSAGGRTVYRWDYEPSDNARIERGAVSYVDYGKVLEVATFPDYAALGLAYYKNAAAGQASGARIVAKAQEIVRGIDGARAQALAIDNWVRKNIRYVAVYIGNGGIVPHEPDAILEARYGDCKDHARLMDALLGALGIDSTPVLINAGSSYVLSPVPSLGEFNHAITYIPALALFLDSTAENVEAGYLPDYELDKQVILTKTGAIAHTPVRQDGQIKNRYEVTIAADGSAEFAFTRANGGAIDEPVRFDHRNWRKIDQDHFVEDILKQYGMKGQGTVTLGDLAKHDAPYAYTLRGHTENWAYLPGTVGIASNSSLWSGMAEQIFGMAAEAERSTPYVCPVFDFVEEATYHFAATAEVIALPKEVTIATSMLQYQARYVRKGNDVLIHRAVQSGKADSRVCTPDDYRAMQADIKTMVRDLRSQFIVKVQ